jgi:pantoate--beta-alanine ligase
MQVVSTISELRRTLATWRRDGERIALVPTMGNLHAGHLSLVTEAQHRADRVVATIFVNPMQFGESEDIDAYPRTFDEDRAKLEENQVDLLFCPEVSTLYPVAMEMMTRVEVPGLSDVLCGASRPGHFRGVATVVAKLFNMAQPQVAVFGEKDFQQLAVIRRMVRDLDMSVEVVGVATMREADGLAMSSRNGYLTPAEREIAPTLYATLQMTAEKLQQGEQDLSSLQEKAANVLKNAGFCPGYVSIRRAEDLREPTQDDRDLVVLAAAWLGKARLIDNLPITLTKTA